jgi:hypothetical protein
MRWTAEAASARVVPAGARRRLKDGACAPAGAFVVGTLALGEVQPHETPVRLERDGSLTVLAGTGVAGLPVTPWAGPTPGES